MFYDKDLMSSNPLGKVWRAGHGLSGESDEEVSMANICDKLDSWVDSSHEEAHRRLSLRTSSIFIDGAARLYKRKLELLFEDTQRLDREISRRKRFRRSIDTDNNISQTFTDPEYQDIFNNDSDEPKEVQELESSHYYESSINTDFVRPNPDSAYDPDNRQKTDTIIKKYDKGVQTSPKTRRNRNALFEQDLTCVDGFDQNLPFGIVVIHENYHSRIPSKIIFSSLSSDISKLV